MAVNRKRRWIIAVIAALVAPTAVRAEVSTHVNRLGRLVGAGWGDGYHACASSGRQWGADLPPRSYADRQQPSLQCRAATFYDQFDWVPAHHQAGGCDSFGCDSASEILIDGSQVIQNSTSIRPPSTRAPVPTLSKPIGAVAPDATSMNRMPPAPIRRRVQSDRLTETPPSIESLAPRPATTSQDARPMPVRPQPAVETRPAGSRGGDPEMASDLDRLPNLETKSLPAVSVARRKDTVSVADRMREARAKEVLASATPRDIQPKHPGTHFVSRTERLLREALGDNFKMPVRPVPAVPKASELTTTQVPIRRETVVRPEPTVEATKADRAVSVPAKRLEVEVNSAPSRTAPPAPSRPAHSAPSRNSPPSPHRNPFVMPDGVELPMDADLSTDDDTVMPKSSALKVPSPPRARSLPEESAFRVMPTPKSIERRAPIVFKPEQTRPDEVAKPVVRERKSEEGHRISRQPISIREVDIEAIRAAVASEIQSRSKFDTPVIPPNGSLLGSQSRTPRVEPQAKPSRLESGTVRRSESAPAESPKSDRVIADPIRPKAETLKSGKPKAESPKHRPSYRPGSAFMPPSVIGAALPHTASRPSSAPTRIAQNPVSVPSVQRIATDLLPQRIPPPSEMAAAMSADPVVPDEDLTVSGEPRIQTNPLAFPRARVELAKRPPPIGSPVIRQPH